VKQKCLYSKTMAEHNEIGKIGENMTKTFLMKQGFTVIEQNYRILQGEIDIIAQKDNILRFVEVKSIKVRGFDSLEKLILRPEDNLTFSKWSKILTTIQFYLKHRDVSHETKYQVDLACVYIDTETRQGRVKLMQNVHKERD
jgi:putative endonuclease